MTCKEKLMMEHPEDYQTMHDLIKCPSVNYGYLDDPEWCPFKYSDNPELNREACIKCWEREIPDSEESNEQTCCIKDSGERREFETGAVRDICEGKGRCDLMPLDVVAKFISNAGADKESHILSHIDLYQSSGSADFLWVALDEFRLLDGQPDIYTMILNVSKHFEDGSKKYGEYNWQKGIPTHCYIDSAVRHYLKFLRGDKDEPHDRAFVWNIICCIWTCAYKPELNDYSKRNNQ